MSTANGIGALPVTTSDPRAAIARAAETSGVDFRYLLAQAKIESGLNPMAQAKGSSAAGLYQFTRSTWLETLDRHGAEHGLGWAGAAIENGAISDPGVRAQVLALRFDPDVAAQMAAEFASDNREALTASLGHAPDAGELYLAHFLGASAASRFLQALSADPGASAAALLPAAAAANHQIFYNRNGSERTLGEVMDLLRGKVEVAMRDNDSQPRFASEGGNWSQPRNESAGSAEISRNQPAIQRGLPSMAETLASTFGLQSNEASENVRAAYGKLRAFGL